MHYTRRTVIRKFVIANTLRLSLFVMNALRVLMRPCGLRSARLLSNSCIKNPIARRSGCQLLGRAIRRHSRPLGVLIKRNLVVEASTHNDASSVRYEVNVDDDGGMLIVTWANQGEFETAAFHAVWLRHNCQCPNCVTSANQKTIQPSILNPDMKIISTKISGEFIEIHWSCGHQGYMKADWLRKNQYPNASPEMATTGIEPTVAMELPRVDGSQIEKEEVLWSWLRNLNEYGICLLTNLSTELGTVKKVAKLVYNVQPTVYGEIPEVISQEKPTNVAYTTDKVQFHMDLIFYESPPGLQLLHCIRFDPCIEGGESIMLDAFPVVEELRAKHPEHFDVLTRVPITIQRIHYERNEPVDCTYYRPHIILDRSGKITAMNWNPVQDGPLSVPKEEVVPYYKAYHCLSNLLEESKYKLTHRLLPGEAMTFNNRRVLHSRAAFKPNGGVRHLQLAYVNIDEFKSKFQVLCNRLGHQDYPVKRVFNHQST